jgi:CDP-6-deoxy-D-xylo-4-hexulose-3-dehydrase
VTDGYNFRNHELGAVLGLSQIKRLDKYIEIRNKNYLNFIDLVKKYSDKFIVPKYYSTCSNFCFPLICKNKDTADRLKELFNENGIEHRPIISGNLLRQPFLKQYNISTNKDSLNVDLIHDNGIYLGNNHFIGDKELNLLKNILEEL